MRIGATGQGGQLADPDAFLTEMVTPMHDWFVNNGLHKFPASAELAWLKVGQIGTNGRYSDTTAHVHDYTTPAVGSGVATVPDILTLCLSWTTNQAVRRGSYASHGRIYPPLYSAAPESDGSIRVNSTSRANALLLGSALLTKINTVSQNAVPIIASGHAGEVHTISGVKVGDVLDVQRRRKDAAKESYVGAVFP